MKLIVSKKSKRELSYYVKNISRDLLIVFSYTIGFCLYALIYLVWTIDFSSINLAWISIPILGFCLGIAHIFFIYKGSLFCKALTMFAIMFYTFALPVIIAVVN